jgi:hypothetical protein
VPLAKAMPCKPVYPAGIDALFGVKTPRGTEATHVPRHLFGVNPSWGDTSSLGGEAHRCSPPDGPGPFDMGATPFSASLPQPTLSVLVEVQLHLYRTPAMENSFCSFF